jgi:DNA topoisomerase-3
MGKRLIIAEKPSVGRDIAKVLNCRESGNGCLIGGNDIVTWAVGHLVGLCYPDEMDNRYTEWKIEDLPIFPEPFQLKVLESSEKQFEIIKALMNDPAVEKPKIILRYR